MRTQLKSLVRRFAGTALLFSGMVGLGTSFVLLVSSSFGYLPYSDRPGAGWWGRVHWPSWVEVSTYVGFSPWFGYFCLFFGVGLFGLSLVLGLSSTPKWLNRILGGAIAAAAAGLAVMGAGWYFALAEIGPDSAVVIGLLYGVFVFPRFIEPRGRPLRLWIRVGAVSCSTAIFLCWVASPFLPRKPIPDVNYDLIRVTAGEKSIVAPANGAPGVGEQIAALKLHGIAHSGISGSAGAGQGARIDLELIAQEPITKNAQLAIPETGYALYVLRGGVWTAYPAIQKKDKRTVTVEPGIDSKYDGARFKLGKKEDFSSFTWYPVIPKGQ